LALYLEDAPKQIGVIREAHFGSAWSTNAENT